MARQAQQKGTPMAYNTTLHQPSDTGHRPFHGTGSIWPQPPDGSYMVPRSLAIRLGQLSDQLARICAMGHSLAGPADDDCDDGGAPGVQPIADVLHGLMDKIACRADIIEGQLKTLTNEL